MISKKENQLPILVKNNQNSFTSDLNEEFLILKMQVRLTDELFTQGELNLQNTRGMVLFKDIRYKIKDDRPNLLGTNMRIKLYENPSKELSNSYMMLLRSIQLDL